MKDLSKNLTENELSARLLSPDEMAFMLGVPKTKLYRETMRKDSGAIPRVKIGKYVRFEPSKVIEWFKQQTTAMQAA